MLHRTGFAVVMSRTEDPRALNGGGMLFGPTVSSDVEMSSQNLCSNGFQLFEGKGRAKRAVEERRRIFRAEGWYTTVVGLELFISESAEEWEELRNVGSYVVVAGESLFDCHLFGPPAVCGTVVDGAHDSWAPFGSSGMTPFSSFECLVGEEGLGTIREMLRQGQHRAWLTGIKLDWSL